MADGAPAPSHSGGGSAFTKKIGGMPAWVVYVGGGLAIGIVYVIWKGKKTPAAKDTTTTDTSKTPTYGQPQGPDIIPINQGLTDQQVGDLVAAISSLQGKQSRPPKPPKDTPPAAVKDWMQQEAELLASQTGESIAQIIWELQGKDPGSGPNPNEDKPLPNDNLYGSWAGMDLGPWADQYLNPSSGDNRGGWGEDQDHGRGGGRGRGESGGGQGDENSGDSGGGRGHGGGRRGGRGGGG